LKRAWLALGLNICHSPHFGVVALVIIMFRKKEGGIRAVAKKHPAIGTFF
jgi:hypothetical protein